MTNAIPPQSKTAELRATIDHLDACAREGKPWPHVLSTQSVRAVLDELEALRTQVAALQNSAPAPVALGAAQGPRWDAGWLTVVYRNVAPGDEAQALCSHPKVSAMSWSHALNDRDALAKV